MAGIGSGVSKGMLELAKLGKPKASTPEPTEEEYKRTSGKSGYHYEP
jgi:hypothetical protein